jgi:hypothetical protein
MRLKFDRLKHPRWVPVTSDLGCHIALKPFAGNEKEVLYRRDIDGQIHDREFRDSCAALGIDLTRVSEQKRTWHVLSIEESASGALRPKNTPASLVYGG